MSVTQVRVWDKGKGTMVFVGLISGNEFHRDVKPKHFVRVYQGYGLQETVLNIMQRKDVERVVLHLEDGSSLTSPLSAWMAHDVATVDLGHGTQRFLPVNRMKSSRKEEGVMF